MTLQLKETVVQRHTHCELYDSACDVADKNRPTYNVAIRSPRSMESMGGGSPQYRVLLPLPVVFRSFKTSVIEVERIL